MGSRPSVRMLLTFRDADGSVLDGYSSCPDSRVNTPELQLQPETCN